MFSLSALFPLTIIVCDFGYVIAETPVTNTTDKPKGECSDTELTVLTILLSSLLAVSVSVNIALCLRSTCRRKRRAEITSDNTTDCSKGATRPQGVVTSRAPHNKGINPAYQCLMADLHRQNADYTLLKKSKPAIQARDLDTGVVRNQPRNGPSPRAASIVERVRDKRNSDPAVSKSRHPISAALESSGNYEAVEERYSRSCSYLDIMDDEDWDTSFSYDYTDDAIATRRSGIADVVYYYRPQQGPNGGTTSTRQVRKNVNSPDSGLVPEWSPGGDVSSDRSSEVEGSGNYEDIEKKRPRPPTYLDIEDTPGNESGYEYTDGSCDLLEDRLSTLTNGQYANCKPSVYLQP